MSDKKNTIDPHLDPNNDDETPSYEFLISLATWTTKNGRSDKQIAVIGYSRIACRNHMRREEGLAQLPIDVKAFIYNLPEYPTEFSAKILREDYGDTEKSKKAPYEYRICYFARLPHMNKCVYYSGYVHQVRTIMEKFKPCKNQIAQIIATIAFGNGPMVFVAVTSFWLQRGCLPKTHLSYAFIHDAFKLGFDHMNSPEFMRHQATFSPHQKRKNIQWICETIVDVIEMGAKEKTKFHELLEKMKQPLGIGETIGTHLIAIIALSGLTVNPHLADVTEGTGPTSVACLKEHYFISTKPQVKTATEAVAKHCEYTIADAEQAICEFGRHQLSAAAIGKSTKKGQVLQTILIEILFLKTCNFISVMVMTFGPFHFQVSGGRRKISADSLPKPHKNRDNSLHW